MADGGVVVVCMSVHHNHTPGGSSVIEKKTSVHRLTSAPRFNQYAKLVVVLGDVASNDATFAQLIDRLWDVFVPDVVHRWVEFARPHELVDFFQVFLGTGLGAFDG